MKRYKAVTPVTDFSVSQRIRVALIEDGHTDLAVESITEPIRSLEEECGHLRMRVVALEQEKVKWQTESGVHRIINEVNLKRSGKRWDGGVHWTLKLVGALLLALLGALVEKYVRR